MQAGPGRGHWCGLPDRCYFPSRSAKSATILILLMPQLDLGRVLAGLNRRLAVARRRASQANKIAAGKVGDGERIAIAPVGQHELALVISAPQIVRLAGKGKRRSLGFIPASHSALDQALAGRSKVSGVLAPPN
jgi:hypothetical protein